MEKNELYEHSVVKHLAKTVTKPEYHDILTWSNNKKSFIINQKNRFEVVILSKCYDNKSKSILSSQQAYKQLFKLGFGYRKLTNQSFMFRHPEYDLSKSTVLQSETEKLINLMKASKTRFYNWLELNPVHERSQATKELLAIHHFVVKDVERFLERSIEN